MTTSVIRGVGLVSLFRLLIGTALPCCLIASSASGQGFVVDTEDQASSNAAGSQSVSQAESGAIASEDAGDIAPLDDWKNVKPMTLDEAQRASSAPSVAASSSTGSERSYLDPDYYGFGGEEDVNDKPTITSHLNLDQSKKQNDQEIFELPYRLTTSDRKMFERVEKRIRHLGFRYQREQAKKNFVDRRGQIEAVVCSLNLAGYGIPKELDATLKRKLPTSALKPVITAIKESGCEVVALQGIVGRSKSVAEQAVIIIRNALQTETEAEWQFVVGDVESGVVFPAILLKQGRLRLNGLATFGEMFLPRYAPFTLRKFPASPLMVSLQVPGYEGKRDRQVLLFDFFIGESVNESPLRPQPVSAEKKKKSSKQVAGPEVVLNMMQIAEGLRQIIEMKVRDADPDDSPILLVAGERNDLPWGVVTRLLEGRQQLKQFKVNGNCALDEKYKEQCQVPVQLPQTLFGVAGYMAAKPGKLPKLDRTLTSDIYLTPDDLPVVYRGQYSTGEYSSTIRREKFGKEKVVLHVLQLNW